MAIRSNDTWSWDIKQLLGLVKWIYFYLYVILDIFSRYGDNWMVATCDKLGLIQLLIEKTSLKQSIDPNHLTMHADVGSFTKAKTTDKLFACLGITRNHKLPHVNNDNLFSESQFKTIKYRSEFPKAIWINSPEDLT